MGRGTTDEARLPRGDAAAAGFFRGAPPAGLRDLANLRGAASGSRFRELRRADPGNPKRPPREPFWNARPVGRSRATVQTVPCRSHARSESHEGTGPGERGGSRRSDPFHPVSHRPLQDHPGTLARAHALAPSVCPRFMPRDSLGPRPSGHRKRAVEQAFQDGPGAADGKPDGTGPSAFTRLPPRDPFPHDSQTAHGNGRELFARSRDCGRADERSKRFRETATRICAPPERTSPRRPPRQCPGRRPRTPTASPQGKIRPPVPRPRTGGSALIPASSPGSASAPRPSTRGAPPSHRRSTSS